MKSKRLNTTEHIINVTRVPTKFIEYRYCIIKQPPKFIELRIPIEKNFDKTLNKIKSKIESDGKRKR